MNKLNLLAEISIPYPPSVNHYTQRRRGGGVMLTDKAKQYKADVYTLVATKALQRESSARLAGEFVIHAPTRRKYDLDNRMKMILDALENAGLFENDEQFDEITIKRGGIVKGGRVDCVICEIEL